MRNTSRRVCTLAVVLVLLLASSFAPRVATPTVHAIGASDGMTWVALPSGTYEGLRGITCPTSHSCIAVGESGHDLTTQNTGANWQSRESGYPGTVHGVACLTRKSCVAVAGDFDRGAILISTNAGATWHVVSASTGLDSIACPTSTTCLAVGWDGIIVGSVDGGATWSNRFSGGQHTLYGIACPTHRICLAVGSEGIILRSSDGGATWHSLISDLLPGDVLTSLTCPTTNICLAVGEADEGVGIVVRSTNGGITWSSHRTGIGLNGLNGVACASSSTCLAVGSATMRRSTDGGATWSSQSLEPRYYLWGVTCPTSNICLAVGTDGTILQVRLPPSPTSGQGPSTAVTSDQRRLAAAVTSYKAVLDTAFNQVEGTAAQLGQEGQYFQDQITKDQLEVYAAIASAVSDTLVGGLKALGPEENAGLVDEILQASQDFGSGVAKDKRVEETADLLARYLSKHTMTSQALVLRSGIHTSLQAGLDTDLARLIAHPPALSAAATGAAISALGAREAALGWIGTRTAQGAAATLHVAFYQQGGSHVLGDLAALAASLWQQAYVLVAEAYLGPEGGVGATAVMGVWNTTIARLKLSADAQLVAAYQLTLLSMERYGLLLHDAATLVIHGLQATSAAVGPSASASLGNLQIVDSGAPASLTHATDTRREVLNVAVRNTGAKMPFHVFLNYNLGFDINGKLTLAGQQKLHLSVVATHGSFQVAGKGSLTSGVTLAANGSTSLMFTLLDAKHYIYLLPDKGEELHVALLAEPQPGDYVLVDSKTIPNDRTVHFPLTPSSHVVVQQPALYVLNGATYGIWSWPNFPASIRIDNHEGFTGLQWTRHSVATASATGTVYYDLCTQSCAGGPIRQAPIELVASNPRVCTVQVFDLHASAWRLQRAYVYDTLRGQLVRSAGVPSRVSPLLQFRPACKAGTP